MSTMDKDREIRSILIQENRPEIRKVDGEPTKIIGYAVRWDQLSNPIWGYFQEKFKKGAFTNRMADVYASWQHDEKEVLGRTPNTLLLTEDDNGLRYEITPPSWADKYVETIERGDVRGSSFIFRAVKEEWDESNPDMPIRTVTEADLIEVSPVTKPAYPQSSVGIRSEKEVFEGRFAEKRADDSSPAFSPGTRIQVEIDTPHMEGQSTGEVREAVLTWVYGIVFDGMEDMGIHKWYVESELKTERTNSDDLDDERKKEQPGNKNKDTKGMDMKRSAELDLKVKLLNLGGMTNE